LCPYCNQQIFWIKGKPFNDESGQVKHECIEYYIYTKSIASALKSDEKLDAIYNLQNKIYAKLQDLGRNNEEK
jgi:hypothetical protein